MNPRNRKHGLCGRYQRHYLYTAWRDIKRRCFSVKNKYYHRYGARGITLHPEWINDPVKFVTEVLVEIGERPADHSIDRINNDGNYEPGNLKWSTVSQQGRNTERNRLLTAFGETLTMTEWAERKGIKVSCIRYRLRSGYPVETALSLSPKRGRWLHRDVKVEPVAE